MSKQTDKASPKLYDKNTKPTPPVKPRGVEGVSQDDKHRDEIHIH